MWRCPGHQEQNTRPSLRMNWARTSGNTYWSHSVNQPRARPYAPLCRPHPRHSLRPTHTRSVQCRTRHARALRPRTYCWQWLAAPEPTRRRWPYNRCFWRATGCYQASTGDAFGCSSFSWMCAFPDLTSATISIWARRGTSNITRNVPEVVGLVCRSSRHPRGK